MTDVTTLVPSKIRHSGPRLMLTDAAESFINDSIRSENVFASVATSAAMFLKSAYLKKSEWFRTQNVHTFVGYSVADSSGPVLRMKFDHNTVLLGSPDEFSLPETYFEERVLAETRVDYF